MLIDMVRLRGRDGTKRSREELCASKPLRGDLTVYTYRGTLSGFLTPTEHRGDPLVLEGCRLSRMGGASFIVVGQEVEHYRGEVRRQQQAWWCRLPTHATGPSLDGAMPTLTRDEKRLARIARG